LKRQNLLLVAIMAIVIIIDQLIKWKFHGAIQVSQFGPLSFNFVPNYGLSFGQLSQSEPMVRVVLVSTIFGLTVAAFVFAVFFLWTNPELFYLRLALSLFFSGVAGNAMDRIRLGYAIDFLEIHSSFMQGVVFNFSDIIQFFGIGLTIFAFFYLNQKIWFLNNIRRIKIINPSFQYALGASLTAIGICSNLLMWAFGHSLMVALIPNSAVKWESMHIFDYGTLAITLFQSIILFCVGIIYSHRISGPIYALGKFVDDLLLGNDRELKLRATDYHPELEKIAKDITKLKGTSK